MGKQITIRILSICLICLLCAAFSGFTDIVLMTGEPNVQSEESEEKIIDFDELTEVAIYVDGILADSGYLIGERTYTHLDSLLTALGFPVEYQWPETEEDEEPEDFLVRAVTKAFDITVYPEGYLETNGRCFYCEEGVFLRDDAALVTLREIATVLNLGVEWNNETQTVNVDTTEMEYLTEGEELYEEEDLYWLARIIHSEANGQPLSGKIGVGNVVMNRVEDPTCPDTIYDVIFDTRYGIQFSPVESGGIYGEPSALSVAAAKMCLEGYSTAGDSLYFVNPEIGSVGWFKSTRRFVASLGDHDFYA